MLAKRTDQDRSGLQSRCGLFSGRPQPRKAATGSPLRGSFGGRRAPYRRVGGRPRFAGGRWLAALFHPRINEAPGLRRSASYSLTNARAIFWEMYPNTAPTIRDNTALMNGFSRDPDVNAPSLLPANAKPAVGAKPNTDAGMSLKIGHLAA